MSELTGKILVFTMCGSEEEAGRLAARLVDLRLAACVCITPRVRSVYRWKNEIEDAEEWGLTIKTRAELYPRVEAAIREAHSYEVPEILAVPVVAGWPAYLDWVDAETAQVAAGADDVIR